MFQHTSLFWRSVLLSLAQIYNVLFIIDLYKITKVVRAS